MDNLRNDRRERAGTDRRTIPDRRQSYDVIVMDILGQERRRQGFERRKKGEQRRGWARINKWISVPVSVYSA